MPKSLGMPQQKHENNTDTDIKGVSLQDMNDISSNAYDILKVGIFKCITFSTAIIMTLSGLITKKTIVSLKRKQVVEYIMFFCV